MTNSKLSAVLLLLAAFVLGALSGGAALALADRGNDASKPKGERVAFIDRLERDLALSPEQRHGVELILEEYRPRMDSMWREIAPKFDTLRTEVRVKIDALLSPEQQAKHIELLKRRTERHRQNGKSNAQ